jgi:alkanesulfonate monooxygenase SsuD/methylene tetrahydromethanopterin reductase-like flavin-dependent oxidoreductase (luciferase family)
VQIGIFTEEPWQHPDWNKDWGSGALTVSNREYDPVVAGKLLNRYLDEKIYADELGFDVIMKNEHHSAPYCMQSVTNIGAAILARETKRARIFLGGNILPMWDDPLLLAEQLAHIDNISGGRLVPGWVRGVGSEHYSHNSNPAYNHERFEEAHDFIKKCWEEPGPFRWEGKHFQYRYVNPWAVPTQKPSPPVWIPGSATTSTVRLAAKHRYPYIRLSGGKLEASRDMFDFYDKIAQEEFGYDAGPEHYGYVIWVHVEDTDEKAYEVGKKLTQGVRSPFDPTTPMATPGKALLNLSGLQSSDSRKRMAEMMRNLPPGAELTAKTSWEEQLGQGAAIAGSPDTVIKKLRELLEVLRIGTVIFRTGDGALSHAEAMNTLKLMGEEVLPAVKEIAKELELPGPFERDPATGETLDPEATTSVAYA